MNTARRPSSNEFSDAVSDDFVRSTQIIHLALASGIILFTFVAFILFLLNEPPARVVDARFTWMMTVIVLLLTVLMVPVAYIIFSRRLASLGRKESVSVDDCLNAIRSSMIIRLALLEGPALYGVTICVMAVMSGVMHQNPVYWINLTGVIVMLFHISSNFPTKDRLVEIFERYILSAK